MSCTRALIISLPLLRLALSHSTPAPRRLHELISGMLLSFGQFNPLSPRTPSIDFDLFGHVTLVQLDSCVTYSDCPAC